MSKNVPINLQPLNKEDVLETKRYDSNRFIKFLQKRIGENPIPLKVAVIAPGEGTTLKTIIDYHKQGYIEPIIFGNMVDIKNNAMKQNLNIDNIFVLDSKNPEVSIESALTLIENKELEGIMKGGGITTKQYLRAIVRNKKIRTNRRMSGIFALETDYREKPLFITDASINITPDISVKADITQNVVDFYSFVYNTQPYVAFISAIEKVNPQMPDTIEAAALSKMVERGQIKGCVADGPLSFDVAISKEVKKLKKVNSAVAGNVDIVVSPDIVTANVLYKGLEYMGGGASGDIVLGSKIPIILTSRVTTVKARKLSFLFALLYRDFIKQTQGR